MRDYVESALEKGMGEICFTGHMPLPDFPRKGARLRMDPGDLDDYFRELDGVRSRYGEIKILTGIEADYYEGYEEYTADLLSRHPFDLVLMSVHFIRSWPRGFWVHDHSFQDKSLREVYSDYCGELKKGLRTGLYDVVAHLDLIKKAGKPLLDTNREEVESILALCREQGMCIEINTSGARKPIGETYPSLDIIRLASARDIPFVIGSDAHTPAQVGYLIPELQSMLADLPGALTARYEGRQRTVEQPAPFR